jgi:hypothetical protein
LGRSESGAGPLAVLRRERSPADVAAGSSATFRAGVRIVLRDGFRVVTGASFVASIDSGLASGVLTKQLDDR